MNPFLINHYLEPRYFCDREAETKSLLAAAANQVNIAFFAQRRLGKTALVQHAFYLLRRKGIPCIYLDIYATQSLQDFTNQLANSIYQVFPENKGIGKKFLEAIKLLRPVITIDESTGGPQLSLDITQARQFEKTIPQLLQFLDNRDKKVIIAIDEFQQVLEYPEKNVEALLRTIIQQLKNVNFIFCGSNQKMMQHIFNSAKRPFYASTKNIHLQKIGEKEYASFIKRTFTGHKYKVNDEAVVRILELTCRHTYYTQRLCHEIFAAGNAPVTPERVNTTLSALLKDNESVYFQYRNLLTSPQWKLLRAIASEEKVTQPYSGAFITSHRLGTPAGVKRSLEALLEKEMVFFDSALAVPHYELNDKFLMRWLQRLQQARTA